MRTLYLKMYDDKDKKLNANGTIRFQVSKQQYIDIRFETDKQTEIYIQSSNRISIKPSASNAINIRFE